MLVLKLAVCTSNPLLLYCPSSPPLVSQTATLHCCGLLVSQKGLSIKKKTWKSGLGLFQSVTFSIIFFKTVNLVSRSWDSEVCPQSQKKRSSSAFTLSSLILSSNTMDRTQTGHVLGNPPPRGAPVVSDRQMSPVVFLLLRLLTHLAMLLGATQSPQVEHCTAQSCTSFYGSFFL